MAQDPTKLPEEEVTPQEQTTTSELPTYIQPFIPQMQSFATQLEQAQQIEEEALEEKRQAAQRVRDAITNRQSVIGNIVEARKPVYDEDKEKRARAAVTIQALGDVLAAATKGAIAYGKRGAGVVPVGTPSNAMEGVAKINEMQQKYLERKKAWDDLSLNWSMQQAQDAVAAEQALQTLADDRYKAAREDRRAAAKQLQDWYGDMTKTISDTERRRTEADEALEREKELLKWRYKNGYVSRGGGNGGGNNGGPKKDYTDQDLATIYLRYNEQYDDNGNVRGYKDYTSSEQKSLVSNAKKHPQTMIHYTLLNQGYSPMLVEDIMEDIDETLAKEIIEGYASNSNGVGTLYDYIMQYLSYETTSDTLGLGEGYQPFFLK